MLLVIVAPSAPSITSSSTTTTMTVNFTVATGRFNIDKYCASFTRLQISGLSRPLPAVMICSSTSSVLFRGAVEDAQYSVFGFVNNTARARSPNSATSMIMTLTAGQQIC